MEGLRTGPPGGPWPGLVGGPVAPSVPAGTWHTRHRVGGMEKDRGFAGNRVSHCLTVQLASLRGGRRGPAPDAQPTAAAGLCPHLLGGGEGHLEVLAPVLRAQLPVVKGLREEVVHQRAEGHAVAPARGKVLDVHVLRGGGRTGHHPPTPPRPPPARIGALEIREALRLVQGGTAGEQWEREPPPPSLSTCAAATYRHSATS